MGSDTKTFEDISPMADEVARLMVSRLGGARRGEQPSLQVMLRRRGGALPRRLRKHAHRLAQADQLAAQPKIARQQDMPRLTQGHRALIKYLQPLGEVSRWQSGLINFAASVMFGLLILAAVVIWLMVMRGGI